MGSVYRKSVTRPLPPGAEIITRQGVRLARWKVGGKARTAPVITGQDGTARIRVESSTFIAKYRDGDHLIVEVPTGCKTEDAARQVLADLERKAERQRAGLITPGEARVGEQLARPIGEHVEAYLTGLEASGASPKHVAETGRILRTVLAGCGFGTLAALERSSVEAWLNRRRLEGASARTRNIDLIRLNAFFNWCVGAKRLLANPLKGLPLANEKADNRRHRRAMTETELARLLDVARRRPVLEALTVRKGPRKGEAYADVRPEVRERLDRLGRERALIYKTLVLTGLRRGELASITIGQLALDGPTPHVELEAADEKNREGSFVPIRADLAADLEHWLADRLDALQAEALDRGEPIPARLPADAPLFIVPEKLVRIFDRDLKAAGIAKRDDRGRTLDVHALRHTFGTLLSKGGVPLRTAQAAMRHADPSLTANVYTDPRLLDVTGALDALPALSLNPPDAEAQRATGTNPAVAPTVAPGVAPNRCNRTPTGGNADKKKAEPPTLIGTARLIGNPDSVASCVVLTNPSKPRQVMGDAGLEPATPSVSSGSPSIASDCTTSTSADPPRPLHHTLHQDRPEPNADPLAAFVSSLTPDQCRRLAALLLERAEGDGSGANARE